MDTFGGILGGVIAQVLGILLLADAALTVLVALVLCTLMREMQSIRMALAAMHRDQSVTTAKLSW